MVSYASTLKCPKVKYPFSYADDLLLDPIINMGPDGPDLIWNFGK